MNTQFAPSEATHSPARPLIEYSRAGIEALIPHRGDILFLRKMTTRGERHFTGVAHWEVERMGLSGHFPQQVVVPAVFLVEAVAQLAGAGVVATRVQPGQTTPTVGVMMAIRRCVFRQVVHVGRDIELDVRVRHMGEQIVMCEGTATMDGTPMASVEVVIGEVTQERIQMTQGDQP